MAITDIQISEELETSAPSIKYSGDEGPKSPQEEMMMVDAMLEEEYEKYVYDLLEQRPEAIPMSIEEFKRMVIEDMSGGQPLPQDPTKPVNPFAPKPTGPVLPDRQMAAYGGIMGVDGRRKYGLGSSLKKFVRKVIPNEVAKVAEVAAPFVAPFNPIAAGLMSGIGGFDRTGKIGSSIKSGLMNYGMGQLARGIGGGMDNLQGMSLKVPGGGEGFRAYFSNPIQDSGGLGKFLANRSKEAANVSSLSLDEKVAAGKKYFQSPALQAKYGTMKDYQNFIASQKAPNLNLLDKAVSTFTNMSPLAQGAIGAGAVTALLNMGPEETVSEIMDRGEGLDIAGIRKEVQEAFKDETGEKLAALRVKYPFLGRQDTKDMSAMAMGGRAAFAGGGGFSKNDLLLLEKYKFNPKEVATYLDKGEELLKSLRASENYVVKAMGGRINKAEGGLMDLGGMEKDYRAEGGFVPIGKAEKADDVPARLSVNEFVFTADAVRNAGGGDIDKGAEVMENMMKHLEQGGQVSDESQGMQGAQQMFETSERLSEVI